MEKINYLGKECALMPFPSENELKIIFDDFMNPDGLFGIMEFSHEPSRKEFRNTNETFDINNVSFMVKVHETKIGFLYSLNIFYKKFNIQKTVFPEVGHYDFIVFPKDLILENTRQYLLGIPDIS